MKYMGSKRWMLANGLGHLLAHEVESADRFIDLFAGSGAVAVHIAVNHTIPVQAVDLQYYSSVLAGTVLKRVSKLDGEEIWTEWFERSWNLFNNIDPPLQSNVTRSAVATSRDWCAQQPWPITRAYGGYYFSPVQSAWLDALLRSLPSIQADHDAALAALISAASFCAAAPGHTAQPFRPTRSGKPFLREAWLRDIPTVCKRELLLLSRKHARVVGQVSVGDANVFAKNLKKGDLVFLDPPYSGVHYSRFYHVLETLARGACGPVGGNGRYPPAHERPVSNYSLKSKSAEAIGDLFQMIGESGATALLTFPQRLCSNGLSGRQIAGLAEEYFKVERHWVGSRFSTLGGNNEHRDSRRLTRELILVLRARKAKRISIVA